jgi:hypothetical protein
MMTRGPHQNAAFTPLIPESAALYASAALQRACESLSTINASRFRDVGEEISNVRPLVQSAIAMYGLAAIELESPAASESGLLQCGCVSVMSDCTMFEESHHSAVSPFMKVAGPNRLLAVDTNAS